jgi:UDP-glucuronate 4-epimerase
VKVLLTGAAGFIGMHVAETLLERGDLVIGVDNLNDYYDVQLKLSRLNSLKRHSNFKFFECDVIDRLAIDSIFLSEKPSRVIHLAAQAGVRFSLKNPHTYIQSNVVGFCNILESCRHNGIEHLVYASSSSVYGANTHMPYSVQDKVDHPLSLYAATKKANELMAHTYSHLYNLPTTGLRYFTVYGPWGRPDMSPWLFTDSILAGRPINVFNHGQMKRDFTYVKDIAFGTVGVLDRIPRGDLSFSTDTPTLGSSYAPYKIYNIGNNQPIELLSFIRLIEKELGVEAKINLMPMQQGDVIATYADVSDLRCDIGFEPNTSITDGIGYWVDWYKNYFKV